MPKPRKPKTTPREDVGNFPSDFPVPVHSRDYWEVTQKVITRYGITGMAAPSHEPHSNEARAQQIRELPGAALAAFCYPAELPGEMSRRAHYAEMNQKELEFQATFDPDAAAELQRRNGELPR